MPRLRNAASSSGEMLENRGGAEKSSLTGDVQTNPKRVPWLG
jgi:hypothetical protein